MGKAERIEIEDFVQNIVERMETPEAFEKMISREEECEAQGRESRLRDVLKKEWPVDEKGERIYQITNIYEEKATWKTESRAGILRCISAGSRTDGNSAKRG